VDLVIQQFLRGSRSRSVVLVAYTMCLICSITSHKRNVTELEMSYK